MTVINMSSFSVHGTLPGGEIWACTVYAARGDAIDTQDAAQTVVNGITGSADWTTFYQWFAQHNGPQSSLDGITGRFFTQLPGPAKFVAESTVSPYAGVSTKYLPNQVAMCASLLSDTPGRHSRGRLYMPATGVTVTASGQVASSDVTAFNTAVVALLHAIEGQGTGTDIVVYSPARGAAYPVVSVRSDSRLDIQRRRANRQTVTSKGVASV